MPLLDNAPYAVQAVFWVAVSSAAGAGIGISRETMRRKVRIRRERKPPPQRVGVQQ